VFAHDQRDPPLPRAVRVPDGAADRRRVQVVAQGPAVRHGHNEARQRPRARLPLALVPRRSDAERPRRVRRRAGEDGGEEEIVDGEAHLAMAQRSVRCAREHLRARVVRLSLPALRRARRGCDRAGRVRALEGGCRVLRCGVRYVSLGMHHPPIFPVKERSSDRPLFYIEMHEGKESEGIESVLQFLKETVPKEAHTAQKRLARFDEALVVMGLEARMKTGRRVALRGPDSAAIAQEWTNVAKQYQSMLPDDDDDSEDSDPSR
jgi:hypothetical protein